VWAITGGTALLAIAHLGLLSVFPHSISWVLVLAGMTALCLKCSIDAVRGGRLHWLMLMSAAMGIAHVYMVLGLPLGHGTHGTSAHHHAGGAGWMLLTAAVEFVLMFACALVIRAHHPERTGPEPAAPRAQTTAKLLDTGAAAVLNVK